MDRSLAEFLDANGLEQTPDLSALHDKARIRALLIAASRESRSVSYSEMLGALGFRFTRPKMRTLCRTLDAVDEDARAAGEPALAVLVVRESDRLPGQGWWTGRSDYSGEWTGAEAREFVEGHQQRAFDYWTARAD